ncbi:MAG: hypothetical protein HOK92_05265 [Flavobacteriales bacterium]|jgi:hypothetical protein|nr:hypothetical protein [Flavobacteriales bacterium]
MKTTKINFALLFFAILISGFANSQQAIYQADKYSIDVSDETEVIIDDIVNPHDESTEPFKALIYPNPSLTGKVKMSWMDNQNVDQILLIRDSFDGVVEISVKDAKEVTVDNLENGHYFVKFYFKQNLLATQKLKVMKE